MTTKCKTVPVVMTKSDCMGYLQISQHTLENLVKTGKIPHRYVGRQLRFSKPAIDAWLAGSVKGGKR